MSTRLPFLIALACLNVLICLAPRAGAADRAAFSSDPVELVDYIFDRYAHLGLTPEATKAEIESSIKKIKVQNHPDRLRMLGEDLQARAMQNWNRAVECEAILLDDVARPLFDLKLADFHENKPHLVSRDGHVIIDFSADSIDVAYLAGGSKVDDTVMREHAQALSGFDPNGLQRAKRMYDLDPGNPDFVHFYRDALQRKLIYLHHLDVMLWQAAGVRGQNLTAVGDLIDPSLLTELVSERIESIRNEAIPQFTRRQAGLLALGRDANLTLLLTHQDEHPTDAPPLSTELTPIVAAAQARFDVLSAEVAQNAVEVAGATDQLLALAPFEVIHSVDPDKVTVHLMKADGDSNSIDDAHLVATATFDGTKMDLHVASEPLRTSDFRNAPADRTTAVVLLNPALGQPLMQMAYAFKRTKLSFGESIELLLRRTP